MADSGLSPVVEAKLASYHSMLIAVVCVLFAMAVALLIAAVIFFVKANNAAIEQRYESDQALACYIQPQMDRSEKTLPTIQYYVEHPDELKIQQAYLADQRRQALEAWGACDSPTP